MRRVWIGIGVLIVLGAMGTQASSLSLQGTYWDADLAGEGAGGGIKLKRPIASMLAADFRASYVQFDDVKSDLFPVEGTVMLSVPIFFVEPYLGLGMGYYFADGNYDGGFGYYGAAGLELHILMVGIFGEIRQMELDGAAFDGPSANVGLMLLW